MSTLHLRSGERILAADPFKLEDSDVSAILIVVTTMNVSRGVHFKGIDWHPVLRVRHVTSDWRPMPLAFGRRFAGRTWNLVLFPSLAAHLNAYDDETDEPERPMKVACQH